jgi:hypothetical protein
MSHSMSSVRLPERAIASASSSAMVVLPSFGTELVTTIVPSGSSTLMNPRFAYSVLTALRCAERDDFPSWGLSFFMNISTVDSPERRDGDTPLTDRQTSFHILNTASYM